MTSDCGLYSMNSEMQETFMSYLQVFMFKSFPKSRITSI